VHKALKLRHHKHTGKLLAHKHTSYRVLFLLMLAPILMMSLVGKLDAMAANLAVTATVPAPIPGGAPTIDTPADGTVTDDQQVIVSGTCPVITPAIIVAIYDNSTFAGSVECDETGNYSLPVSLVPNQNILIATVTTITNGVGDSSSPITVTRHVVAPPHPTSSPAPAATGSGGVKGGPIGQSSVTGLTPPLMVLAKDVVVVIGANRQVEWHGAASGGTPSYTFAVHWGDGQTDTREVADTSDQTFTHTFKSLHTYNIDIILTDTQGEKTTLRSAAVVLAGQKTAATVDTTPMQVYPPVAFVQQYAAQIYIVTASALVFLWYLESGRHIMSFNKLIRLLFHH
jgi:hypothetical protein